MSTALSPRDEATGFLERLRRIEGETRKVIATEDLALISNTWRGTIVTPDGQEVTAEGTTGEVARRQPDGTWRLVIDDPAFVR